MLPQSFFKVISNRSHPYLVGGHDAMEDFFRTGFKAALYG